MEFKQVTNKHFNDLWGSLACDAHVVMRTQEHGTAWPPCRTPSIHDGPLRFIVCTRDQVVVAS